MDKIDLWEKQISKYKKFNLEDAKKFYILICNENDTNIKSVMRKNLINSTLHAAVKAVKSNPVIMLSNGTYDEEDIISISVEYLIKSIDSGYLLKVDSYGRLFSRKYYNFLTENLINNKNNIDYDRLLNSHNFSDLLDIFLKLKNTNDDLNIKDFYSGLQQYFSSKVYLDEMLRKGLIDNLFIMFNSIYNKFNIEKNSEINITKNKLYMLKNILVEDLDCIPLNDKIYYISDYSKKLISHDIKNKLLQIISSFDEKNKNIICEIYGLNNRESKSYNEVAEEYNVSMFEIFKAERKVIKKIFCNPEFQEIRRLI